MSSKKLAILTVVYTLLCFVGTVIFAFATDNLPSLLEIDIVSYRFLLGLSLFINMLPSIMASVFFVGIATYVDKNGKKNTRSFSSVQMGNFQRIIVMACANVIILFCAAEIFQPLINEGKVSAESRYLDYNWYVEQSKVAFDDDEISSALFFIDTAITLYPGSQEAIELKESYERAPAENAIEALQYFPELALPANSDEVLESSTVYAMLLKARDAFSKKNYFDAHYYAFVGLELGGLNNPNSQELQMISLEAWNILEKWSGFETDDDMKIFELKREGYAALIEGDSLSAYYIFLDLHNDYYYDPDITRYFDLSKNALQNEFFFIDETSDLTHFEKAKNVTFSVTRADGLHYDVNIAGITNVKSTGSFVKYLRNYSATVTDLNGDVLFSFTVPYVKLIGQPLSALDDSTIAKINVDADSLVPRLLLTSVDRNTNGIVSAPHFTQGDIELIDDSLTFLPMSLDDFELILDASAGPAYINLASLYSFIPKANQYGFSTIAYTTYFLQRTSYPFLLLAIFLFLAIQAWNYRLAEDSIFRYYWTIVIPLFSVVAEGVRVLLDYGMSLISLSFAKLEGMWQIPATIIVFLIIIIVFSIRFLSLHTEPQKQ